MATIKDVAKAANVSVATVSRVMNKSPKASKAAIDAVESAMKALGYRPNANARALVSQSTKTLGILVGDVSDPFFGSMTKSIDNIARQNDKHLLICNGYHNAVQEREAIELLINNRCKSLIIHSKALSNDELIAFSKEAPGMVFINRHIPEIAERCIYLDNQHGAYLATEYLIKHGHRAIGFLASNQDIEDTQQRLAGYRAALEANGIPISESLIESGSPDEKGGESAMTSLLSKGLPITAIAAYNDYMAAGGMAVLEENQYKLPEMMSVIGFDDGLIARYLTPKLTTIRYPIQIMAEKATLLALNLADENVKPVDTFRFSPTLVRRNSVIQTTPS